MFSMASAVSISTQQVRCGATAREYSPSEVPPLWLRFRRWPARVREPHNPCRPSRDHVHRFPPDRPVFPIDHDAVGTGSGDRLGGNGGGDDAHHAPMHTVIAPQPVLEEH
jgi:hypothetical protein